MPGIGGSVRVTPDGGESREVTRDANLPAGPVHLTWVHLGPPAGVTDNDLSRLVGLTSLKEVSLVDVPITDAGLVHLGKILGLTNLYLDGTRVTDHGLKHLSGLRSRSRSTPRERRSRMPALPLWHMPRN